MRKRFLQTIMISSLITGLCVTNVNGQTKLSGTIIGDPLDGRERLAFDGDVTSFYDAGGPVGANHGWLGYALDGPFTISKVRFHPRVDGTATWPCEKMTGGVFQGSNDAAFTSPVTLATISTQPDVDAWKELAVTNTTKFKYVRYLAPDLSANTSGQTSSNLTVAEIEFYTSDVITAGPKKIYIPNDWKDPNQNIQWDSTLRCKQSANFAVFWGPLAGNDPTQASNTAIRFDPQTMLDSMENIYGDYITKWHLLPDSGNLAKYKLIVVMNNTWRDGLYTGYLFGGGFDNVIGAMFIDPGVVGAPDSWGLSHEFTHSCQYMITNSLYPGHGFNDAHSGFMWETHAQYMAWQRHPDGLGNADPARNLNFTTYTMSSARKHYANIYYLELLKDKYGIDFVGRMWKEADYANKHEHPFQTIQRLLGLDQNGINQFFMEHAMRNVKWDYSSHASIQAAMDALGPDFNWRNTNILDSLGKNYYAIPDRLAPQQYGYNIVPLYPSDPSCPSANVHMKFKGHVDANAKSGWLYAFVSVNASGNVTYSNQFTADEITYKFPQGATEYYLVVMGAPTAFQVHKDLFEIGFPKEFRYPWEIHMEGMVPKGYQKDFHNTANIPGAPHPNGGGFVASTAHVDATAYVGPDAAVLENAQVLNNARVEGKATIRGAAIVKDNAIVKDFADVTGNTVVSGTAKVSDQALLIYNTSIADSSSAAGNAILVDMPMSGGAKAYGDVFDWGGPMRNGAEFGGDSENFGTCGAAGKYLQVEGLVPAPGAPGRSYCDGVYNNILNVDTNKVYSYFGEAAMAFAKTTACGDITGDAVAPPMVNAGADQQIMSVVGGVTLTGTATSTGGTIASIVWVKIAGPDTYTFTNPNGLSTQANGLTAGVYQFKLIATDNFNNQGSDTVTITVRKSNEPPVASAGKDVIVTLPKNDATLTATASDPDDAVVGIAWTQVSGPTNAYIVSPGSITCSMDNLVEGVYVFAFTVTDAQGATTSDSATVTVKKAIAGTGGARITAPSLYPVPASDMVVVSYPPTIGGVLSVFDTKGSKVMTQQVPPDSSTISFSVNQLADGVYYIRIDTNSGDKYKLKMIVAH